MPRHMSFALTESDLVEGRKDVTRRLGWLAVREGETIVAVRKAMGLRKGERQVVLGTILVKRVSRESLDTISADEVRREGFAELTVDEFISFFCGTNRCDRAQLVTRIEFQFTPEGPTSHGR